MALTLSTEAKNASVAARTALVDGGTLRIRNGTTTLCDITLGTPSFGAPSGGSATASGLPLSGTAVAGTATAADNYQVLTSGAALRWAGTVSGVGGGGDCQLVSNSITSGETVEVDSWTHAQP